MLGRVRPLGEPRQGFGEAGADAAADAAVGEAHHLLVVAFDQARVDIDPAEIVDDDAETPPAGVAEDVVEQGSLAGAQIAADDGE